MLLGISIPVTIQIALRMGAEAKSECVVLSRIPELLIARFLAVVLLHVSAVGSARIRNVEALAISDVHETHRGTAMVNSPSLRCSPVPRKLLHIRAAFSASASYVQHLATQHADDRYFVFSGSDDFPLLIRTIAAVPLLDIGTVLMLTGKVEALATLLIDKPTLELYGAI